MCVCVCVCVCVLEPLKDTLGLRRCEFRGVHEVDPHVLYDLRIGSHEKYLALRIQTPPDRIGLRVPKRIGM